MALAGDSTVNIQLAVELIKRFESFVAKPYLCPAGKWTIGYGSTRHADGTAVTRTDPPITREQAEQLMLLTLERDYLPGVLRLCPGLADERLSAIVSFAYNCGLASLEMSQLRKAVNAGDWVKAKTELKRWVRAGGVVLPGLVTRRQAEADHL